MGIYWINDNIQLLTSLKFFQGDADKWNRRAMLSWWFALLFNLVQHIREFIQASSQLEYYKSEVRSKPEKKEAFKDQFEKTKADKTAAVINIIKTLGDLLPSTKGSGMADRLGLKFIDDFWCGLGGSVSAAIFLWQTYK